MYPSIAQLKSILLNESYISEEESKAAEEASSDSTGFVNYLISNQILNEALLGQALAEACRLPYADLGLNPPDPVTVKEIPEEVAKAFRIIPTKKTEDSYILATDNPAAIKLDELQAAIPNKKLFFAYSLPIHINNSFNIYESSLETRFSKIMTGGDGVAPKIVEEIVSEANKYRASDIHFEPQKTIVRVRLRIDGTLVDAGNIPSSQYENILNKIKVDSGMRIDEHFGPQDGSMQLEENGQITDLRISVAPTINGEKIAIRVLSTYIQDFTLKDIGLRESHLRQITEFSHKPFGTILTVGPTGSGKTTTLYSILRLLNQGNVNITTIEDPVELRLPGTNQIQVKEQSGVTFAKGLRSILRQDPDVILVGEIRDSETAEISVNAALTGHLVLSTFHSNDAASAIPRLIDMGIEPFLLASTLQVVIAQRLVRKLCNSCRFSVPVSSALADLPNKDYLTKYFEEGANIYKSKGCNACNNSGYKGRTAIYELIVMTPALGELLLNSPSSQDIWKLAISEGSVPMIEDGFSKVKDGLTTISEVLRVVEPPKVSS